MSQTPFEHAGSFRIGTVDFVSPDEIKVLLDIEAPDSVALNAGSPRPFPRVNGYLLIPVDDAYLVGQIEWMTVERSPFPKRRGMQDFGLIDLPYPLRKISLNPLGTLRKQSKSTSEYEFQRGADSLPSIGTGVLLPTEKQLRSIVESGGRRRVKIGTSPLAAHAEVRVDPDRIFGRHLAVLGNTGSGKSCSVAGLIRWSLEQAYEKAGSTPNARFIVLDPNGEYSRAFAVSQSPVKARIFRVEPKADTTEKPLQIPLWFWNSEEWCAFTQASTKTQRPTLIQALRAVRDGQTEVSESSNHDMKRYLQTLVTTLRFEKNSGSPWSAYPKPMKFYEKIKLWKKSIERDMGKFKGDQFNTIKGFVDAIENLCVPRREEHPTYDFTKQEVENLIKKASTAHSKFGGTDADTFLSDADAPLPFRSKSLFRAVEATAEMLNVAEHVEPLLFRIRNLLTNTRIKAIMGDAEDITLENWLTDYIGANDGEDGTVTIIDLSLVPTEIIHTVTAVVARIVFEAHQRYRKMNQFSLPTVVVMEEAHTFARRYKEVAENQDAASMCCQVFERIAREGRKFGVGLVLSSQRPSEISPTVLSQCNTFLLHRISNDRDQELVHRLVPDNLKGLLRELPSLPSQNAILLGWASELPVLVRMNDLPQKHQPQSTDPDYWDVWIGKAPDGKDVERKIEWKAIVDEWQKVDETDSPDDGTDIVDTDHTARK